MESAVALACVVVVAVQLVSLVVCFRYEIKRAATRVKSSVIGFMRESKSSEVVLHIRENESGESRCLGRVPYHSDRASHLGGVRAFLESFEENPIVPWPFEFWDVRVNGRIAVGLEPFNDLAMHGHLVTVIRSHVVAAKESAVSTEPSTTAQEARPQPRSEDCSRATGDQNGKLLELNRDVLEDVLERLVDAKDVARAQLICKDWWAAGIKVRCLRIVCLDVYHEWARDDYSVMNESGNLDFPLAPGASGVTASRPDGEGPSRLEKPEFIFKEQVVKILKLKSDIVELRVEVEPKLQSKIVGERERRRTDFWLADPWFLRQFLPQMGSALQHLSIVDYGKQALQRRSNIIEILSRCCKFLRTLDLRNMFINTRGSEMISMVSFTLSCVKVDYDALEYINLNMPNLQTLLFQEVFGAEGGMLTFREMKVLCLGLSTPAKYVHLNLPKLEKLHLKNQCPQKLIIDAFVLKYVALNLECLETHQVYLRSVVGLEELLYRATSFDILVGLVGRNVQFLQKVFLDIPCMALGEDGRFLGVIKEIILQLPSFTKLHQCEKLSVLNIGPGLWHSMEMQVEKLVAMEERSWPLVRTLILHMIPFDMESALMVLRLLLRPSVTSLTVLIHTFSPVGEELLLPRIEEIARRQGIMDLQISLWAKGLNFSCFSFY